VGTEKEIKYKITQIINEVCVLKDKMTEHC